MAKRIVIGLIATIVLLGGARHLSRNRAREIRVERVGRTISHQTVFEQVGPGEPVVRLEIEPAVGVRPFLLRASPPNDNPVESPMTRTETGVWEGRLPAGVMGERVHYAFRIDVPGEESIRLPRENGVFYLLRYKGEVTTPILILHIIFMFGAFFCMVQSFWSALAVLRGGGKATTVGFLRWVMITTFVGGWPIGFLLNYQRFGAVWEGFPFGYDITDNKTQIIFLFWLVTALLVRGSFFGKGEGRDAVGPRGLAWAVIVSFIVSLALYMVPHSL